MTKTEQTQAVFTRLSASNLRELRLLARREGTTSSAIIRRLTEAHLAKERARRKAERAAGKK